MTNSVLICTCRAVTFVGKGRPPKEGHYCAACGKLLMSAGVDGASPTLYPYITLERAELWTPRVGDRFECDGSIYLAVKIDSRNRKVHADTWPNNRGGCTCLECRTQRYVYPWTDWVMRSRHHLYPRRSETAKPDKE